MSTFDALAPTYDADFTQQPLGQYLRNRVHQRLLSHYSAGDHLLEIGCGTGEDALFLAEQGLYITATDANEAMLKIAQAKTADYPSVSVKRFDLTTLPQTSKLENGSVDGVFSNFGALNCIDDWQPLAKWLSEQMPSGAKACFGVMSPFCAWEFIWHVGHFKWDIALRRLRGDDFGTMRITYPTIKRLSDDFSPYFKRINVMPLGLFLPTSALFDVVQKRPHLMKRLITLEKYFQDTSQLALLADHYWIEFERL
ncbi:MAG: methyltransferase domain-containing protein [Phototrophicaceae bacterium]